MSVSPAQALIASSSLYAAGLIHEAHVLKQVAAERDRLTAEVERLRGAWLRVIQAENTCGVTGKPCDAVRCGCAALRSKRC